MRFRSSVLTYTTLFAIAVMEGGVTASAQAQVRPDFPGAKQGNPELHRDFPGAKQADPAGRPDSPGAKQADPTAPGTKQGESK
jgi:hypothetical protein